VLVFGSGWVSYPFFRVVGMDLRSVSGRGSPVLCLRRAVGDVAGVDVGGLSVLELRELSGWAGRLKTAADSLLCRIAAEVRDSGTAASAEAVLQKATRMSKRDAKRLAKVAGGLCELPNVAGRFACGDMTLEHTAALVDTAGQTGAAAVDANTALLERAGEVPADLFARDARRFAAQSAADRGEELLRRQRKARRVSLFTDCDTGMGRLSGFFDPVSFGLIRQAIDSRTNLLRRTDNTNTNTATAAHEGAGADGGGWRTDAQRRADAFFELVTERDALTHKLLDPPDGTNTTTGAGKRRIRAGRARAGRASAQLVVAADIGVLDGTDPTGRCEIPGTGPIPPSMVAKLSPDAKLAGMIFDGTGRALWLGRNRRTANLAQHLAITVRDSGCIQCGAPMHQCHIHHIRPWEHGGLTDIDNLTALCGQHHRQHHGPHNHPRERGPQHSTPTQPKPTQSRPTPRRPTTTRNRDGP